MRLKFATVPKQGVPQNSLGSRLDNSSRFLHVTGCSPGEGPHQDGDHQQQEDHFQILYRDEHLVAIDKPSGFHVHAPEDGWKIPREGTIGVFYLPVLPGHLEVV